MAGSSQQILTSPTEKQIIHVKISLLLFQTVSYKYKGTTLYLINGITLSKN